MPDGKIGHAELRLGGGRLYVADQLPSEGGAMLAGRADRGARRPRTSADSSSARDDGVDTVATSGPYMTAL